MLLLNIPFLVSPSLIQNTHRSLFSFSPHTLYGCSLAHSHYVVYFAHCVLWKLIGSGQHDRELSPITFDRIPSFQLLQLHCCITPVDTLLFSSMLHHPQARHKASSHRHHGMEIQFLDSRHLVSTARAEMSTSLRESQQTPVEPSAGL